jgi:tetratricopeptide (TPR) repeat protein
MTPSPSRATFPTLRALALPGLLALAFACAPSGAEDSAVRRGDEAFARDSLEEALAEYRLAMRQGSEEPGVLARAAHTFIALGRIEEATELFLRAAAREPRWGDMGVSDLVRLARNASERNDRFQMAAAMDAARRLRPGLSAPDLTLPLARHYRVVGEYGRAVPLYRRALDEASSPSPSLLFEIGETHREIGDCRSALIFFDHYQELAAPRDRARADFNIGDCSYSLARELRGRGGALNLEEALGHIDRSLDVGEPRSVQGLAWFEKGEILSALGDCDGSMEAFTQVRYYESGPSPLVTRAQRRIDDVRYGRGLVSIRGSCG